MTYRRKDLKSHLFRSESAALALKYTLIDTTILLLKIDAVGTRRETRSEP